MQDEIYDVVIIGGGVAGLTAGIYTCRAGLRTLMLERLMPGGQVINAESIENFPGFPDGISGAEIGPRDAAAGDEVWAGDSAWRG